MILQILLTAGILGGLMGLWLVVLRSGHRQCGKLTDDGDLLEGRWGCHGCLFAKRCRLERDAPQSPTP